MKKVILIAGASSGMGKQAAIMLAKKGHKVYAGARRLEKMSELKTYGIVPVEMDVTDVMDNKSAVRQILQLEGKIDVLINNAGFGLYGPVEEVPIDDAKYQFEVNLFGLAHLTQQVIPHMRKQKTGRIINISSMGGKIFTPMGAWYHATKHALEGWSDCLRIELKPFNIDVVLIEPGGVKTEFGDVVGAQLENYYPNSAYQTQMDPFLRMMNDPHHKMMDQLTAPDVLAKEYVSAVSDKHPKRRYVKGAMAKPMLFIRKWMGDSVFEWMITRTMS